MIGFIGSRSAWKSCRDTHHKPIGTDAPTCLRRAPARRGTARTRRRTRRDDQWILRRAADGHGSKVHGDVRARASLVVRYYRGVPGMTISTTGRASAYAQDTDRSEEHTYELQSLMRTSYAVLCLKKKNNTE